MSRAFLLRAFFSFWDNPLLFIFALISSGNAFIFTLLLDFQTGTVYYRQPNMQLFLENRKRWHRAIPLAPLRATISKRSQSSHLQRISSMQLYQKLKEKHQQLFTSIFQLREFEVFISERLVLKFKSRSKYEFSGEIHSTKFP